MSKHTPGPWQWYWRVDDVKHADCGVYYQPRDGIAISVCRAPRYEKSDQWEANASLIAAAPELLEALRTVTDMLLEWHADLPQYIGDNEEKAIGAARAAIAKAEGKA